MSIALNQGKNPLVKLTSNEALRELYLKKTEDIRPDIQTLHDVKENFNIKIVQDSSTFITEKNFAIVPLNKTQISHPSSNGNVVEVNLNTSMNLNLNKSMKSVSPLKEEVKYLMEKKKISPRPKDDLNNSNISYTNRLLDQVNQNSIYKYNTKGKGYDLDNSQEKDKNQSSSYNPTISTRFNNSNVIQNMEISTTHETENVVLTFSDYKVEENELYGKFKKENVTKW